mmetsp:Transcript_14665/g.25055  ORF Transcript_14665/g.25055 Transcript_14665/m.25055 type:complete len:319 (+) Transcript_14665:288-1244(+)
MELLSMLSKRSLRKLPPPPVAMLPRMAWRLWRWKRMRRPSSRTFSAIIDGTRGIRVHRLLPCPLPLISRATRSCSWRRGRSNFSSRYSTRPTASSRLTPKTYSRCAKYSSIRSRAPRMSPPTRRHPPCRHPVLPKHPRSKKERPRSDRLARRVRSSLLDPIQGCYVEEAHFSRARARALPTLTSCSLLTTREDRLYLHQALLMLLRSSRYRSEVCHALQIRMLCITGLIISKRPNPFRRLQHLQVVPDFPERKPLISRINPLGDQQGKHFSLPTPILHSSVLDFRCTDSIGILCEVGACNDDMQWIIDKHMGACAYLR